MTACRIAKPMLATATMAQLTALLACFSGCGSASEVGLEHDASSGITTGPDTADTAVADRSVPDARADRDPCRASSLCKAYGACTTGQYGCIATADADCRASRGCAESGKCWHDSFSCRRSSDADCKASTGCRDRAACTSFGSHCAPGSSAECRKAPGCAHHGRCTYSAAAGCHAASAADCASSTSCIAGGFCDLDGQSCRCSVPPCVFVVSMGRASTDCPGGTFCPCLTDDDCDAGPCRDTPSGRICAQISETCLGDFKMGFDPGGDGGYSCRPEWGLLCRPCDDNAACEPDWAFPPASACVRDAASGAFCAPTGCKLAGNDAQCPERYGCRGVVDVDGKAHTACVPIDEQQQRRSCPCAPYWTQLALTTSCSNVNAMGSCAGVRRCADVGSPATACDAPAAATEACGAAGVGDGLDQDCDGATDEGCGP